MLMPTVFSDYIEEINKGVVWADLDIKALTIFIIPIRKGSVRKQQCTYIGNGLLR